MKIKVYFRLVAYDSVYSLLIHWSVKRNNISVKTMNRTDGTNENTMENDIHLCRFQLNVVTIFCLVYKMLYKPNHLAVLSDVIDKI